MTVTNKQYRSMVIKYRPGLWRIIALGLTILLVVLLIGAYFLGSWQADSGYAQLKKEYRQLQRVLNNEKQAHQAVLQRVANLEVGAKVDREAVETVRQNIALKEQKILDLKEEVSFYKGLMAPGERQKGVGIRDWSVRSTPFSERFRYKVTVQQLTVKHRLLVGTAIVKVFGSLDGKQKVFSLTDLDDGLGGKNIKLRFKYFQTVEGELVVPPGFLPSRVEVTVQTSKPKKATVKSDFSWDVSGG